MEQQITYASLGDRRIASAAIGDGRALVLPAWWVSDLADDWRREGFRDFVNLLAARRRVIRYDRVGTGCSDRQRPPETLTLDWEVGTLEAVVDAFGLDSFDLLGISCGGCTAVRYAARHPERVRRIVLYGSYADGRALGPPEVRASMVDVVRAHWGLGARLLADVFLPGATADERDGFSRLQRTAADREVAAALLELIYDSDVRVDLTRVRAPTLVAHRRADRAVGIALGRQVASLVPGAQWVELGGDIHPPWHGDSGAVLAAASRFLGIPPPPERAPSDRADAIGTLSERERQVLRHVAQGLTDPQIAELLQLSPHTVHRHVANVRAKLGLPSRAAAAAHAARAGLA